MFQSTRDSSRLKRNKIFCNSKLQSSEREKYFVQWGISLKSHGGRRRRFRIFTRLPLNGERGLVLQLSGDKNMEIGRIRLKAKCLQHIPLMNICTNNWILDHLKVSWVPLLLKREGGLFLTDFHGILLLNNHIHVILYFFWVIWWIKIFFKKCCSIKHMTLCIELPC